MAATKLISESFGHESEIPAKHTCEGDDTSPPLAWRELPADTSSVALVVEDPDAPDPNAPMRVFVHWVLYNLPPEAGGLPEGAHREVLPPGTLEGTTDFGRTGWGGPCPPIGRHRYFFRLFALDTRLPDLEQPRKPQLLEAMDGHVLEEIQLVGTYQKKR